MLFEECLFRLLGEKVMAGPPRRLFVGEAASVTFPFG
jgi:hypothetical protein